MPLFHFYALAGVLVVGAVVVVAFELAEYHRREQEKELEMWQQQRSARMMVSAQPQQQRGQGTAREGEDDRLRQRLGRQQVLLDDRDPFCLTDDEVSGLGSPLVSHPSGSEKEKALLSPSPPASAPAMSRTASIASSTSTEELFSIISTPTLVSRPVSPSPSQSNSNAEGEQWDLINQKLHGNGLRGGSSIASSSEDGWEALEESVDWGRSGSEVTEKSAPRDRNLAEMRM